MIGLLCFVLAVLASPFKSKSRLEAENAVLRHQAGRSRPSADQMLWNLLPDAECREASTPGKGEG